MRALEYVNVFGTEVQNTIFSLVLQEFDSQMTEKRIYVYYIPIYAPISGVNLY
jgi:hypothetical protein